MIANWMALRVLGFVLALTACISYADGITGLSSGEIEILPTLAGDAKMQGNVVFGDFQLLSQYFGNSGTPWDEGNFSFGSETNFGDFQLLSQNFGQNASGITGLPDPPPPQVTLTLVASGGNYTVYANDTTTDNAGIASFDIDVVGDGGAEVTSSYNYSPIGVISDGHGYELAGFGVLNSSGDDGGDGMNIEAMQDVIEEFSESVIQGYGQGRSIRQALPFYLTLITRRVTIL
jgi:hypothetical protein